MKNKKYWHELPQEQVDEMINDGTKIQFVLDNYLQPDWCNYPNALAGPMGCWSLIDNAPNGLRTKISHEFCRECDCYKKI